MMDCSGSLIWEEPLRLIYLRFQSSLHTHIVLDTDIDPRTSRYTWVRDYSAKSSFPSYTHHLETGRLEPWQMQKTGRVNIAGCAHGAPPSSIRLGSKKWGSKASELAVV